MSLHFCKLHSPNCCTEMLSAGSSQLPIIHFLMEFRLRPVAGLGEDWVSLVIPHRQGAELQTYLLQGLTPGDSSWPSCAVWCQDLLLHTVHPEDYCDT